MTIKITRLRFLYFALILYSVTACNSKTNNREEANRIEQELATIDSLLRDTAFARTMAGSLDSAYYLGIGQIPQTFLTPEDDTAIVLKLQREEKVATNLAGFYALECGIGLLNAQTNTTPVEWLQKITNGSADTNDVLLLNRFANTTWKASQPFRGLSRITLWKWPLFSIRPIIQVSNKSHLHF